MLKHILLAEIKLDHNNKYDDDINAYKAFTFEFNPFKTVK